MELALHNFNAHKLANIVCANCGSIGMRIFYEIRKVPVHSVLLHTSREEAVNFQSGDITLGYCPECEFISNTSFNPGLQNYLSQNYEATQAFSDTFNEFHRVLANRLVNKYSINGKKIVEIGCGQGEFIDMLCSIGENSGVGFDPAYVEGKYVGSMKDRVRIVKDYYTENIAQQYSGDFIVCKMTLEHIHKPYEFVSMVSRSIHKNSNTFVFFQVPNALRILEDAAFWDIYYEHCSYFTPFSLRKLFEACGFEVLDLSIEYDRQYLTIEAKPSNISEGVARDYSTKNANIEELITNFQCQYNKKLFFWNDYISTLIRKNKKIALWGGGSKAVAFLTSMNIGSAIDLIIDINPNKNGTFLAGTGTKIVSPHNLKQSKPDLVIVMNPIYMTEITNKLSSLGIVTDLIPIDAKSTMVTG